MQRPKKTRASSTKAGPPVPTERDLAPPPGFEEKKRASFGQVLFKSARLLNELAIARLREKNPDVRLAHTRLLPHVDFEGTRLTTLAERMGVTKQAAGQLVEELESLGLLLREADPQDGRAKRVRFTAKGKKALQEGLVLLGTFEGELGAHLGEARMDELKDSLGVVLDWLEGRAAD
jgi:DNA-binding MarR family transcriptional regulator